MIFDIPNIGPVQFRDDLTEEQFNEQLNKIAGALGVEIPRGELTTGEMASRAITRGAKRLGSTFGDIIPAMGAKALGFDEYAQRQMGEAADTEKEIAKYYAPQYESTKDIKGISDLPGFALETVAEQVPNIATSLVPGVGAGAIAARVGAGTAAKVAAANAGVFLGSYAQNAPEVFQNVYQATGKMDVPASLIFGAGSAALDSILPAHLASKLTGPVKVGIVENLLAKSGMEPSLLRSVTAETLKGLGMEGVTEGTQEAIGIAAEKFVADHPQVFSSDDWNRIMESSIRGAIAGSAFGGVGGVGARMQEKREEFAQEQQRQLEERRQELANTVKEAGLTIDEFNALQKQGVLPGMETGMYTQLLEPKAKEEATKELKGKQLSLFDEQGVPTKVAEASKTKGDKAEAIRLRQQEQREAAELKATQAKLKQFFKAKQGELNLQEAPPVGGAEVAGQPDLFGAPQISEPTVVKKPGKLTPKEIGTTVNDDVLGSLGIGSTALIRKNKLLEGKDISNPADAAEVRRVLEAYADRKNLSTSIREKVEEYLNRPEFQAQEVLDESTISGPTEPVGGTVQPSVPSVEQQPAAEPAAAGITEPDTTGLGAAGPTIEPTATREEAVNRPLSRQETNDLAKAEAAVEPAIEDKLRFVQESDDNVLRMMEKQLPKGADTTGLEDTDAFRMLRLVPLIQEYDYLKQVMAKSGEDFQRKKNEQELAVIRSAISQATPDGSQLVQLLDQSTAREVEKFIDGINKQAREAFAPEVERRAAAPVTQEQMSEQERLDAQELEQEALAAKMAEDFVNSNVAKAIAKNDLAGAIDELINEEENPEVKQVLEKIKGMGLKTAIRVGKIEPKPGRMNMYDIAEFDPATNTITYDPEFLNKNTTVHEIVHAALSKILLQPNHPLTKEMTALYEGIYNQLGSSYGALDIHEFAAELISNPEFQATLKAIKAPRGGNLFQRAMQAIAEFFGFKKGTSAYDAGLKAISDIIDISGNVDLPDADKMYHGVGTAVNQAFEAVGDIGRNMPELSTRAVDNVRNTFSNLQDNGLVKAGLGLLRLDNLNSVYGTELPSIQTLIDALEQRNGRQEQDIAHINEQYKRFSKAVQADPKAAERMNNMAVDARLAQVDPLDANFKTTPQNVAAYNKLRKEFLSLPKDLQDTYREIRQSYTDAVEKYEDLLLAAASPSLQKKLKAEFEARKRVVAYIPFLRRGDYWLEYADPETGERTVQAFESVRERDSFIAKDLPPGTQARKYKNLQDIRFIPSNVPPTTFIGRVIRGLQADGASSAMLDSVYQSYLALMPAESISKRFMKSDDVLGMERDIVRGFGDTMIKWTRKLADSEFAPRIDQAITAINEEAKANGKSDVVAAAENINSQSEFFHNPTYGKLVSGATALSYFEYIAGNVSSALINLTSLPMFTWPVLGAKFGFDKASSAMLAASKVVTNGMENDPRYKKLYQMLRDHGQLEHTMAREVLEARRMTTGDYLGIKARIMDALSYPFSATERYNRGVTSVAAFDLARGMGMSEEAAMRYALNTVKDINTSGMAVTAPKYMQTPIGRVFFTFKSFAWNSAFIVARSFHQTFLRKYDPNLTAEQNKEIRRMAARQLVGIFGMAGAFAGVKGLPFMGLGETLMQMINALFGDDDEPFDFDTEMREFFGELLYKGPVNFLTNLEIANRTGVAQDLLFRDDPRSIAEHGYALSAMRNAFGPVGSYIVNAENAIKMMNEGHTERAIEALMPSFVRNGMKGMRYMGEGAMTLKGDPVEEDVGAYNSLMQIIGFSPASLSSTYEKTSAAKGYEKAVADRKQKLLNKYDMAQHSGDTDLMADVRTDIANFNSKHPANRISGETLAKSKKAREAAQKNMINGVTFNKKMKAEVQDKFFSDED